MRSPYFLIAVLTLFFVNACSNKDSNPVKSDKEGKIVLKEFLPEEIERGGNLTIHGSGFGDSTQKGYVLFGDIQSPITVYTSAYYISVKVPQNAQDGLLRVVFNKETSNALPYKIKQKKDYLKPLLKKVEKVIIYSKFYLQNVDTLVYELSLNEKYSYETSNFKLSVDTIAKAIKIQLPKQGLYYEQWGGPPCDTSAKIIHTESWKLYDVPIKFISEDMFIARRQGVVGTTHIYEYGYAPEYHNHIICDTWYKMSDGLLTGWIEIIFQCKK